MFAPMHITYVSMFDLEFINNVGTGIMLGINCRLLQNVHRDRILVLTEEVEWYCRTDWYNGTRYMYVLAFVCTVERKETVTVIMDYRMSTSTGSSVKTLLYYYYYQVLAKE